MSLVLRNLQRAVWLRRAPLRRRMEMVRQILGVQKFDVAIICVDNKEIQHINRIYRKKDVPTDVLSFPYHENLKAGEIPLPDFPADYDLGDIFLGVEYISQQCRGAEDFYDVLTVTATHGLCHLLGFTHSTEAEWQKATIRPFPAVSPALVLPGWGTDAGGSGQPWDAGPRRGTRLSKSQMFQKEKQVLEELSRHMGTRLQPLTRGLF